jgi:hypothetical protein
VADVDFTIRSKKVERIVEEAPHQLPVWAKDHSRWLRIIYIRSRSLWNDMVKCLKVHVLSKYNKKPATSYFLMIVNLLIQPINLISQVSNNKGEMKYNTTRSCKNVYAQQPWANKLCSCFIFLALRLLRWGFFLLYHKIKSKMTPGKGQVRSLPLIIEAICLRYLPIHKCKM